MKLRIILLFILASSCCFAQQEYIDSLKRVWMNTKLEDTVRLNAMVDLAWDGYLFSNPDSTFYYAEQMYRFAEPRKLKRYEAIARSYQATSLYRRGQFKPALEFYGYSLAMQRKLGDKSRIAAILNNSALIYVEQGNYSQAIDYFNESLKLQEFLKNKSGQASTLLNIGTIYVRQGELDKALQFCTRSLALAEEIQDLRAIGNAQHNIGNIYYEKAEYEKSIRYITKSLELRRKIEDFEGIASCLTNLGRAFLPAGRIDEALTYQQESYSMFEKLQSPKGLSITLNCIGDIYKAKGEPKKAEENYLKALDFAQKADAVVEINSASKNLFQLYDKTNRYKEALAMHELFIQSADSLNSEKSKRELVRQEFKVEYEKKEMADSLRNAEEKKVVLVKLKEEQTQRYGLYGGLILLVAFAFFMFSRYRVINRQKEQIQKQKELLDEKQREVLDSIHYARRIQQALLPTESYIKKSIWRLKREK
jgi:tetratricopeptide (TPR) repeat protein